jgi:putative peptidoglycan lipid II flippase
VATALVDDPARADASFQVGNPARKMVLVAGMTVLARLALAVRDIALARHFNSDALDGILVATTIAVAIAGIVGGAAPSGLIPMMARVEAKHGIRVAESIARRVTFWIGALALGVVVAVALGGSQAVWLLASGFSPAKRTMTIRLLRILVPVGVLGSLASIWSSRLNLAGRFGGAIAATAVGPLIVASTVIFVPIGPTGVAWVLVGGAVLETIIIGLMLGQTHSAKLPMARRRAVPKGLAKQYCGAVGALMVSSGLPLVDQAVASTRASGSIALLSYGSKVASVTSSVAGAAVIAVLFPRLARSWAASGRDALASAIRSSAARLVGIGIGLGVMVAVSGPFVLPVLLRGSRFAKHDLRTIVFVNALASVQIPFAILGALLTRTLSTLERNGVLVKISIVNVIANLVADVVLVRIAGVAGIALASGFTAAGSCALLAVTCRRLLQPPTGSTT